MTAPLSPAPSTPDPRLARNAVGVTAMLLAGDIIVTAVTLYLAAQTRTWQMAVEAALMAAFGLTATASLVLSLRQRTVLAMRLLILGFLVATTSLVITLSGLGIFLALIAAGMVATLSAQTLPEGTTGRFTSLGFATGLGILLYDLFGPAGRLPAPPLLQATIPLVGLSIIALYGFFIVTQFNQYRLQPKLVIGFLTVSLLPLTLLAFLNDRATRQSLLVSANRTLQAAASETATKLDAYFNTNLQAVGTEASLRVIGAYLSLPQTERPGSPQEAEIVNLFFTLQNKEKLVRRNLPVEENFLQAYSLLDRQGRVTFSTDTREMGQDWSGRDFVQQALSSAEPVASSVQFLPAGTAHLYFAARAFDANLATVGLLITRYDAAVLQKLVAENNDLAGQDSFAVLFDENQLHLAHGILPDALYRITGPLDQAAAAALQAARRLPLAPPEELSTNLPDLAESLADADAQPFFEALDVATGSKPNQVAVARMASRPWQVAFFQPREAFLAPAEAGTRNTVLLAVVIAVVVAAAATLVARQLSGPLARLTAVTEAITAGDLAARARVETGDEIGTLAGPFNSMAGRLAQTLASLEQRVAERTSQLQAAAEIGRATTSVRNLDELLRLALHLIRERFGYYHASIFLMDSAGEYAVLRESTGEVGQLLKARGHRLAVGSRSLIGWITQSRRPRVARDTTEDPFHFRNPLLPETRSELAIPLVVGSRLVGALDVQSTTLDAFGDSTVQVLQTLADLLSVAIENAELFERTQTSLEEVSALYQQVAGAGWRRLLYSQSREMTFELSPGTPAEAETETEFIAIPLRLRGEVVGTIELHGRAPDTLQPEEQAVLETAGTQLAVALESAALFEEAQRRSRQEQLVARVSDQIRASLNPNAILQSGIRELGKALGATEVVVQLYGGARRRGEG